MSIKCMDCKHWIYHSRLTIHECRNKDSKYCSCWTRADDGCEDGVSILEYRKNTDNKK